MLHPAPTECDWTEDFPHENGDYTNRCVKCGEFFRGHKRRFVCRVCNENLDALMKRVYHVGVKSDEQTTKDENGQANSE